jgi:hypothetical protein
VELVQCLHERVQKARSRAPVQGYSQTG